MTTRTVSSGVTSSGLDVLSGAELVVLSGGTAVGTTVVNGGVEVLSSGASASSTLVRGGSELVGGSSFGDTLVGRDGGVGVQSVGSGGVAKDVVVSSGGDQEIAGGGLARGVTVSEGGHVQLDPLGSAGDVSVLDGGELSLDPGGIVGAVRTTTGSEVDGTIGSGLDITTGVLTDAAQDVLGGRTFGIVVSGGALQTVDTDGEARGTVLRGGQQAVIAGGLAVGTVVSVLGAQFVSSATALGSIVSSGGEEVLQAGSLASGGGVEAGGVVYVDGGATVSGLTVRSGGRLVLSVGADASAITVQKGGIETVDTEVSAGAVATSAVVSNGAEQKLDAGGVAVATRVAEGSEQHVYGRASNTLLAGSTISGLDSTGNQIVESGGYSIGVAVGSGGNDVFETGASGGSVSVMSGGRLSVHPDAVVSGVVVSSGGEIVEWNGATLQGATIDPSVHVIQDVLVSAGASYSGAAVVSGALVQVDAGGTAIGLVVRAGGQVSGTGGTVSGAWIRAGGDDNVDGVDDGASLVGVSGGGVPVDDVPLGYAYQDVAQDGLAVDAVVGSGGWQKVYGRAIGTWVMSGGVADVREGGSLQSVTLGEGAELRVFQGAFVAEARLRAGSVVDLAYTSVTSVVVQDGDDLAFMSGGFDIQTIRLAAAPTRLSFSLASDGNGGTDVYISSASASASLKDEALIHSVAAFAGSGGAIACLPSPTHPSTRSEVTSAWAEGAQERTHIALV